MRTKQRESVDSLFEATRTGRSVALVLCGEPRTGHRTLFGRLAQAAADFRVSRVVGAQSCQDLPFAGLHRLCAQMLDQLDHLSPPQREVLRAAFDPSATAPDPRLVGLAVFSLLAHAAENRPIVCVIQNAQWLDKASRQALAFTARRLVAESVALLFMVPGNDRTPEFAGLPLLRHTDRVPEQATAALSG